MQSSNNPVDQRARLPRSGTAATEDLGPKVGQQFNIGGARHPCLLARSSHHVDQDVESSTGRWVTRQRRFLHRVGPHPAREAFQCGGLREEIMALCKTASGLDWRSVGLYRLGMADMHGDNPVTVLITVRSPPGAAVFAEAASLVQQTEQLVGMHFPDVHVEVITYTPATPYADDAENDKDLEFVDGLFSDYNTVWPGRSIGPVNTTGTGSLSGYICCRRKTTSETTGMETTVYALACHHVAAFGRIPSALAPVTAQDAVAMTSPAEGDHALYLKSLRMREGDLEETISRLQSLKNKMQPTGRDSELEGKISALELAKNELYSIRALVTESWSVNHALGTVLKSSGIEQPKPGHGMVDWAIILPDTRLLQGHRNQKQRTMTEEILTVEAVGLVGRVCRRLGIATPPSSLLEEIQTFFRPYVEPPVVPKERIRALCRASDEEDPEYVYIRGRSTPFSVGRLHDTQDGVRTRYESEPGSKEEFVSTELVVLDVRRGGLGGPHFSAGGDSGAPVRLIDGSVVGFVVSSVNREESTPVTYVTMAETMLDSIATSLGADEVRFVGEECMADGYTGE